MPSFLENSPKIRRDADVTPLSSFRTEAVARYFLEIRAESDLETLSDAVADARSKNLPVVFVSGGTNCLFAFDAFPGLLVRNLLAGIGFESADRIVAASGENVHALVLRHFKTFASHALVPWSGLPGTVAGAVAGNAGCFGLEASDILEWADVWSVPERRLERMSADALGFSYRSSVLKGDAGRFVVRAAFDVSRRKPGNPHEAMTPESLRDLRQSKQPAGRTCGSFFKNPPGTSAGALIDRAGLKGAKVGEAEISTKHANFFLAHPGATWRDVLALAELAKSRVESETGIRLEPEARIVSGAG